MKPDHAFGMRNAALRAQRLAERQHDYFSAMVAATTEKQRGTF
jgi:hypothetical protein